MTNIEDRSNTVSDKVAAFISRQSSMLLVIVAILALSASFFTVGVIRVLLGLICVICSFVIMQRAIVKSVEDRWGEPDKK